MPRKNKKNSNLHLQSLSPRLDISKAIEFKQQLIAHGYKEPILTILLAQVANESGGFKSQLSKDDFNFGGVKYQKTFDKSAKSSKTHSAPAKEDRGKSKSYDSYKSIDDFIEHWPRRTHLNEMIHENKVGPPLNAVNLKDYVHRVTLNHYNQDSEKGYYEKLLSWSKSIKKELPPDIAPKSDFFEPFIPQVNLADDLRVGIPTLDPKKNLYQNTIKTDSGDSVRKMRLNPPDWKFEGGSGDSNTPATDTSNEIFDPFRVYRNEQPPLMNFQRQKQINYPDLMHSWTSPELQKPASDLGSLPISDFPKESNAFSFERRNNYPEQDDSASEGIETAESTQENAGRSDGSGRTVNINLNTPMIGNFTINTSDTCNGLADLRSNVEEALLEILNSANTI